MENYRALEIEMRWNKEMEKICRQVGYYFSDKNLLTDDYFRDLVQEADNHKDGWVRLPDIMKFKLMAAMGTNDGCFVTESDVVAAIQNLKVKDQFHWARLEAKPMDMLAGKPAMVRRQDPVDTMWKLALMKDAAVTIQTSLRKVRVASPLKKAEKPAAPGEELEQERDDHGAGSTAHREPFETSATLEKKLERIVAVDQLSWPGLPLRGRDTRVPVARASTAVGNSDKTYSKVYPDKKVSCFQKSVYPSRQVWAKGRVDFPAGLSIGRVVGRKGATIQSWRQQTGAQLSVEGSYNVAAGGTPHITVNATTGRLEAVMASVRKHLHELRGAKAAA